MYGSKEVYAGGFSGFSFCLTYTKLTAEEVSNIETPLGTERKIPNKGLLSLATEPGKEQPSKTENLSH